MDSETQITSERELHFESVEECRKLHSKFTHIRHEKWTETRGGTTGDVESFRVAELALQRITEAGIRQFGKDQGHPGCKSCLEYSVFGGPRHEASSMCRSGRHPHCTCDTCY